MSFGVRGARISVGKRGTYVNLGINGIYYRQRINGNNANANNNLVPGPVEDDSSYISPHTITTENVENVTDVDSQAFVNELESKANKISLFKFFGIWPSLFILLYFLSTLNDVVNVDDEYKDIFTITKIALALLLIILSIWCIFLFKQDKRRKTLEIYYTIDNEIKDLHDKFLACFQEFSSSKKIWQKLHEQGAGDSKYFAGASKLISRASIKGVSTHRVPSPFLKTNVSIPYIGLKNTDLYFFPERLILKRGNKYGAVFYKNIMVRSNNVRFIEEETVPSDADIVDHTWKFLNKKGGPDKRFNNNRILPICLYTDYIFESERGVEEVITTSKTGGMDHFMEFLKTIGDYQAKIGQGL